MKTLEARYNGQLAGTRKSDRPYTHAIVTTSGDKLGVRSWHQGEENARKAMAEAQRTKARWAAHAVGRGEQPADYALAVTADVRVKLAREQTPEQAAAASERSTRAAETRRWNKSAQWYARDAWYRERLEAEAHAEDAAREVERQTAAARTGMRERAHEAYLAEQQADDARVDDLVHEHVAGQDRDDVGAAGYAAERAGEPLEQLVDAMVAHRLAEGPRFARLTIEEETSMRDIVARAGRMYLSLGEQPDALGTRMDLEAVHATCPLDLHRLAEAPAGDFAHDVLGIARHLDRATGNLGGCFLPRCARPVAAEPLDPQPETSSC